MFPCFIPFSNVCNPSHASQRLYVFGCLATFACFPALGIDLMSFPSLRFGCIICLEFWFPFGVIHFCCVFRGGVGLRVGVIFLQKWRGVRGILENNIFLGHDFSYLLSQEKYITFTSHPIYKTNWKADRKAEKGKFNAVYGAILLLCDNFLFDWRRAPRLRS